MLTLPNWIIRLFILSLIFRCEMRLELPTAYQQISRPPFNDQDWDRFRHTYFPYELHLMNQQERQTRLYPTPPMARGAKFL
jgi:hypothetical protein